MITISVCLSDLPKDKITTAPSNGKKYINLVCDLRKENDKFGNTHTLFVSQTKEQREAKEAKIYVGNGKEFIYKIQTAVTQTAPVIEEADLDEDLSF